MQARRKNSFIKSQLDITIYEREKTLIIRRPFALCRIDFRRARQTPRIKPQDPRRNFSKSRSSTKSSPNTSRRRELSQRRRNFCRTSSRSEWTSCISARLSSRTTTATPLLEQTPKGVGAEQPPQPLPNEGLFQNRPPLPDGQRP